MNIYDNGCPFCNEFNGHFELSYFWNAYGKKRNIDERCVFETDNFACVPPLGSFCEGYLLIVPRFHYLSMLTMPLDLLLELKTILTVVSRFIKENYKKNTVFFEHGSSSISNPGGMSVVHAHIHCVPCSEIEASYLHEVVFLNFPSIDDVKRYWEKTTHNNPYLLYLDTFGKVFFHEGEHIPSQYMRRIMCNIIRGDDTWNWKQYPYLDNIRKTVEIAKEYNWKMEYRKHETT